MSYLLKTSPLTTFIVLTVFFSTSFLASAIDPAETLEHKPNFSEIVNVETLSDSEATDSLFIKFLTDLPSDNTTKAKGIKDLMEKASAIPGNFSLIYHMADRILAEPESDFHDNETYILFLNEVIQSSILGSAEKERAEYLLEMALKNRQGTKAADFTFINKNGSVSTLHGLHCENNILLMFYDPDCFHCHETIKILKDKRLPNGTSVMAIDIAGDKDLWDKTKSSIPDNWISGFATDPIEDSETYIFQTMPTLFLLDKNKTVILKDTSIDKILSQQN